MIDNALIALDALFDPMRLAVLFAGMLVGMVFGMLPGLGGVAAVSILLPFIYYLDDYSGLAMLLGAVSFVYTSDTITSVLLGAPGSPASAPTAIEGHALAKQGQAARAPGVGFLASMVGGLVGSLVLFFAIPIAGPIVLMLSTPELFMVTQNPDLMFLIVWSVALTSIVGAALCFAITPMLARLTRIPFAIIAAPLVLVMVIGAYQATSTIGDIFMLFMLGALGWLMKHGGWPRAAALVGFVLSGPMEQDFWLTNQIRGWSLITRPGVLIIASIIVIPLLISGVRKLRQWQSNEAVTEPEDTDAAEE